jgi:hypothetical protein
MIKNSFCLFILISFFSVSYSQKREGQMNISIGNNHLFQSAWKPYQNQPWFGVSYFWKAKEHDVIMDAGFNMSFDFNDCTYCSPAFTYEMTYDADVIALHFGLGKWWRNDPSSFFLMAGVLGVISEYATYTPSTNMAGFTKEYSSRLHAGLYLRSGMDFRITKKGLRLGPFLETRITTGETQSNLYLTVNGFIVGINLGIASQRLTTIP